MHLTKVLLVDDNQAFREITESFLSLAPHLVVVGSTGDGWQALTQAQRTQPDLILVDLQMPSLSGLELIPGLRRLLPCAAIIALTLMKAEFYRQAALDAGADEFVEKAQMDGELLPTIQRLTGARIPRVTGELEIAGIPH